MKLITYKNMNYGTIFEKAIISFGNFEDEGFYIALAVPLFYRADFYDPCRLEWSDVV